MATAFKVLNRTMALLFLISVLLQYNDPDPVQWMAIYGAGFVACLLADRRRGAWWLPLLVAAVALGWAAMLAPHVIGHVMPAELFESMRMKSPVVEEGRETGGLLIITAWMLVLTVRQFRLQRAPHRSPVPG